MQRLESVRLTRRDMLRLTAGGAGMFVLTSSGLAVSSGLGSSSGGGALYIEAFPTSPLILSPFNEALPIPTAMPPIPKAVVDGWENPPGPDNQDFVKNAAPNKHQLWPGTAPVADYPLPIVYQIKLEVRGHDFTSSMVQPIDSHGRNVIAPGTGNSRPRNLPHSTIYGFNGTFPGPMINFEYTKPALVRFENHLDVGYERQDFGSPNYSFITHLHNGHTASESDGNPGAGFVRFNPLGRVEHEAAYEPGESVDNLYLGYPAGDDDREIQSFFWFHDHVHGYTSANVYKGMVGTMPLYDPKIDRGDETDRNGLQLPGLRTDHTDGSFDVEYDLPLVIYDTALDDGVTPHKDAHNGHGETHPEWWGQMYFRHLPNHGFVGDIFTVNGKAFPVLEVTRRKYRLRFLDASISRIYEFKLMSGHPKAARDMGYEGDELQGQYRLPDGEQCMKFVQVAGDGGLLPSPIIRDSFELWPAKRREVIVDFSTYMDGTPTQKHDELYLVDVMKMTTGRMWDSRDSKYKVPVMKIVIGDDPSEPDMSVIPAKLRDVPDLVPGAVAAVKDKSIPTFELQRGTSATDPETEWLINGQSFDAAKPMISVKKDSGGVWRIRNGGGGWVHPMHLHMEEHRVVARNGKPAPDSRHPDDSGKEDVVALDPAEDVVISRRFRTFTGPYVAHCHNLAHEDHNMMFGWDILP
jgi:FtsP/CotA-like multicopper oxidase with cupredoxin domain